MYKTIILAMLLRGDVLTTEYQNLLLKLLWNPTDGFSMLISQFLSPFKLHLVSQNTEWRYFILYSRHIVSDSPTLIEYISGWVESILKLIVLTLTVYSRQGGLLKTTNFTNIHYNDDFEAVHYILEESFTDDIFIIWTHMVG